MASPLTISQPSLHLSPRWIHFWALLTVCTTFPLLILGAEVTTKGAGMADPVGFRTPWHLLTVWLEGNPRVQELNYVVEHSHRIVGFVVGICVIVLALAMWRDPTRKAVRWLGVAALAAVIAQGVLGIVRVNYHNIMGPETALIHGLSAQLVFLVVLSTAVVTSRTWQEIHRVDRLTIPRSHSGLAVFVMVAVYTQMILGAFVRHRDSLVALKWHVLVAFLVVAAGTWLVVSWLSQRNLLRSERLVGYALGGLLLLQVHLGLESVLSKYVLSNPWTGREFGSDSPTSIQGSLTRSFHYVTGTLLFGTTFVIALFAFRRRTAGQTTTETSPEFAGEVSR